MGNAMTSVRQIAEEIVAREGGFVNDPADPGGATNHGVTIHTMRRLGLDVTRDGRVDVADVRRLTRGQAVDIYLEHYFRRPGLGALPEVLQASVFDMYVNAGSNAVKILQRLVTDMGHPCTPDGVVGPQTIRAVQMAAEDAPAHIADAYAIARRNYYYALADARPASRKFARRRDGGKGGWILRAEEFMADRYRLTEAQHRERTRAWA
jgi:lysozyme family protein